MYITVDIGTVWLQKPGAKSYFIVFDAHSKITWGINDIGCDPIVVVPTEQVSDALRAGQERVQAHHSTPTFVNTILP